MSLIIEQRVTIINLINKEKELDNIMVKAVYLDIDGTLVSFINHRASQKDVNALRLAKKKGVLLFIASGRHCGVPEEGCIIDGLNCLFDGYVCISGQYCYTSSGDEISKSTLDKDDVRAIVKMCNENDIAFTYINESEVRINKITPLVVQYNAEIQMPIPREEPINPDEEILSMTLYLHGNQEAELLAPIIKHSEITKWGNETAGVVSKQGSKLIGIEAMNRHFGITMDEVMAIGDAENDLTMIKAAGIGVAMGNAAEHIRIEADYITKSCEENGIFHAFKHFNII
ncbi:MAG: Cof-type HAD-IIB family hydrolase [Oscillospiraceae bacterium]